MPASKPKSQHKKIISVSCTEQELSLITLKIKYLQDRDRLLGKKVCNRSQYILQILEKAIANRSTCDSALTYPGDTIAIFQVSCPPAQYQSIIGYCDRNIDKRSRSRWIVEQILNYY